MVSLLWKTHFGNSKVQDEQWCRLGEDGLFVFGFWRYGSWYDPRRLLTLAFYKRRKFLDCFNDPVMNFTSQKSCLPVRVGRYMLGIYGHCPSNSVDSSRHRSCDKPPPTVKILQRHDIRSSGRGLDYWWVLDPVRNNGAIYYKIK